jgi:hypothetical protein
MTLRVESPNEQPVASDTSPVARRNLQIALCNTAKTPQSPLSRSSSVVARPIVDSPPKKLIAASGNDAVGLQLSRRF